MPRSWVSVSTFNDANKAWASKIGLTYPLLSDVSPRDGAGLRSAK
jgi:hypothetical protein